MEPNYNTSRMPELRALAKEHSLQGYSRLRKDGLIAFLRGQCSNGNQLRCLEVGRAKSPCKRALIARLLQKKAELIALLKDMSEECHEKPTPLVNVSSRPRPPRPTRPAPPPPESSLTPYELERAFSWVY